MSFTRRARIARRLTLALLAALVLYLSLVHILAGQDILFRWVVSCIPLLAFVPGLVQAKYRTGSWLCFVLLLYFIVYSVELGTPGNQWGDALALTLIISLFISAMFYSRWQQRADHMEESNVHDRPQS